MKFPALGGHSIEVDCNVIEKSLHFMHFCTIDFEEMTDPRFLSNLIFLTLILITKYSDQFWEVHFIVLKPRKERPRKIKVEHWIIFFKKNLWMKHFNGIAKVVLAVVHRVKNITSFELQMCCVYC